MKIFWEIFPYIFWKKKVYNFKLFHLDWIEFILIFLLNCDFFFVLFIHLFFSDFSLIHILAIRFKQMNNVFISFQYFKLNILNFIIFS